VSLRVQKRTRSIGPYVSSSVSERSAPYAIFSPGWRRMGVRARNDDGLRGTLAAAEYPTVGLSGKGQIAKLEQEGDTRYVQKEALETLGRLQEPVLEETERALQKAIRLYPQNAEAHYILGVLLKERGRLEEAGRAFQEAIRLNPQDALGVQ
jgi:Flp pilus assembly protein TadD